MSEKSASAPAIQPSLWFDRATIGAVAAAMGALTIAAAWPAWADIFRIARRDEEASHIWLVPIVAAWIIYVRRHAVLRARVTHVWVGPLMMVAALIMMWVGFYHAVQVLWHLGAVVLLLGGVTSVVGASVLRAIWPAALIMLMMAPVPGMMRQAIALPLQSATANVVAQLLWLVGVPVERAGSILLINDQQVAIAEACNGLRMVFALLLVCYAYALITPLRSWVRITIIAISPIVAMLCNLVRMTPTVWLYGYGSMRVADLFHDAAGWAMLIVAMLLVMGFVRLLRWIGFDVDHPDAFLQSRFARRASSVASISAHASQTLRARKLTAAAGALLAFVALGMTLSQPSAASAESYHQRIREVAEELPYQLGAWVGRDMEVPPAAVALLRPNVLVSRNFMRLRDNQQVSLLLVQCREARDMLGHYPPVCYPSTGYQQVNSVRRQWQIDGRTITGMEYEFARGTAWDEQRISVINFMILPGRGIVPQMQDVRAAAADFQRRVLGAAQVQLVFPGDTPQAEKDQILRQFVHALGNVIDAVEQSESHGKTADHAALPQGRIE